MAEVGRAGRACSGTGGVAVSGKARLRQGWHGGSGRVWLRFGEVRRGRRGKARLGFAEARRVKAGPGRLGLFSLGSSRRGWRGWER